MADRIAVPAGNVAGNSVETLAGSTQSVIHDLSMWGMFWQADIVVKLVILLLLGSSFYCWKIIFDKYRLYHRIHKHMKHFEEQIWSGSSLETFYKSLKNNPKNPLERVFVAGMYEWENAPGQPNSVVPETPSYMSPHIHDRVLNIMQNVRNREISSLEKNLGFLATVGSAAPFVGLFGTVWGIMQSFQSIAVAQNASLAVVAPGIAEALFATAIGLFAAIPAVIFYNNFANRMADFSGRIDGFIDEFASVLSRDLDG